MSATACAGDRLTGASDAPAAIPYPPPGVEELELPPFAVLAEQASLEGLSPEVLETFRARAVPEPAPVLRQAVELTHDDRHDVPTTLVCCSIPSAQVLELARGGHPMFADVARLSPADDRRRRRPADRSLADVEPPGRARRRHRGGGVEPA